MNTDETFDEQTADLMLYQAGELTPTQTAAMRKRIESDPALAARLAELNAADAGLSAFFAESDAGLSDGREAAALRDARRLVNRWQDERLARPAQVKPRRPLIPSRWWMYPSAAAAVILMGLILWGTHVDKDRNEQAIVAPEPPRRTEMANAFTWQLRDGDLDSLDDELTAVAYLREQVR